MEKKVNISSVITGKSSSQELIAPILDAKKRLEGLLGGVTSVVKREEKIPGSKIKEVVDAVTPTAGSESNTELKK